jgi:cobalt-zinc-cadmium efflux system protein
LLFDGVPADVDIVSIHQFFGNHENIESYHDLHVWALSTTEISLSVHVVLKQNYPNSETLLLLSEQLHDKYTISHSTIQIETQQYSAQCHSLDCSINL